MNVNLEIGFIPIDPFMKDDMWRDEMRDNIKLARHIDAARTSPTWLAPLRAYEGSPVVTWLKNKHLLRERIENTDEYRYEYVSKEVVRFIEILGPAFCDGKNNGLYNLKREIKNVQRYPFGLAQKIQRYCDEIINSEIEFVEILLDMDLYHPNIYHEQMNYSFVLKKNIKEMLQKIEEFDKKQFTYKLIEASEAALKIIAEWNLQLSQNKDLVLMEFTTND